MDLVQFHCYDIITANWDKMTYEFRKGFLHWELPQSDCVHLISTAYILNDRDAGLHHRANLKAGYEGSIYRSIGGYYKGTRSWDLMKFKDFEDSEATIVGYEEGKGKREGTLGKFVMEDSQGIQFGCPPGKGYNYEDMTEMLDDIHSYLGKIATFTYFGRTKAMSYRHPLFKCIRNYE
jgi:ATP-dependent DNA ligase